MPSPTAAQVAAAEEIVARIVSADAIAGRRSGEARQAHWRAIMATVLAEREAAVRAEIYAKLCVDCEQGRPVRIGYDGRWEHTWEHSDDTFTCRAAALREAARG